MRLIELKKKNENDFFVFGILFNFSLFSRVFKQEEEGKHEKTLKYNKNIINFFSGCKKRRQLNKEVNTN